MVSSHKVTYRACYFNPPSGIITLKRGISVDDKEFSKRLGQQVRRYRKLETLTQEKVADMAGINDKHLGRIERGEKTPSARILFKLMQALNIQCTFFDDIKRNNS